MKSLLLFFAVLFPSSIFALDLTKFQSKIDIFDASNITDKPTKVLSKGPDITLAKKYVYLTCAAYCSSLSKWRCPCCLKANKNGYKYLDVIENTTANTLVLFTINKKLKEIVITFRGTYNVANVLEDVSLTQVSMTSSGSKTSSRGKRGVSNKGKSKASGKTKSKGSSNSGTGSAIKVHNGFLQATNSLYPQLAKKLVKILNDNKKFSVVVSGHSLGAAIASVTLYMLQQKMNLPKNFATPTYSYFGYGEPRVGNQAYADYWNKQSIQISRIVSKADPIPHVPPAALNGYVHHGTELWIPLIGKDKTCSKKIYEDPKCSNSLGPLFNLLDHIQYWDVSYLACGLTNPLPLLEQFVVPLSTKNKGK